MLALSSLDWHQSRRLAAIPTISLLVGPVGAALESWQDWCGGHDRNFIFIDADRKDDWSTRWLTAAGDAMIHQALLQRLKRSGISPSMLSSIKTMYDLQYSLDSPPSVSDPLFIALANAALTGKPLQPAVSRWPAEQLLPQLAAFDPSLKWPAIFIAGASSSIPDILRHWIDTASDFLATVPIAFAVTSWDRAASSHGTDRYQAVLEEGLLELHTLNRAEFVQALEAANVQPLPPAETVDYLVSSGVTRRLLGHCIQAAQNRPQISENDVARSEAELYLFQLLQRNTLTHGLFRLNQPLGFQHGGRVAVGDLVAESLRLVVEVDGKYYHLKEHQYRLDRRKDWLYQLHDYWVLRFLAEDVWLRTHEVMTSIEDAVRLRRQRILHQS